MKILLPIVVVLSLNINSSAQWHFPDKTIEKITYKGNYPKDKKGNWTEDLQGISNNKNYWFFTQMEVLWRVPVTFDLRKSRRLSVDRHPQIKKVSMPAVLVDKGYNHFGDPDNYDGFIFIPVEKEGSDDTPPVIAVFQEENLNFIGYQVLKGKTRSGWCAINPVTKDLYTSDNKINEDKPIDIYKINWSGLKDKHRFSLTRKGTFILQDLPGNWHGEVGQYIQGGDFSDDGLFLFILNGKLSSEVQRKGISVYRNVGHTIGRFLVSSRQRGDFKYEFQPQFPYYHEPEGLTYGAFPGKVPAAYKGGQLHAILLNKEGGKDGVYIKHYEIALKKAFPADRKNVRFVQ